MRPSVFRCLFIALTALTSVHAATIVQTQNFSGIPNLNANLTFNKFNPALGTLTGVNVEMRLSTAGGQCGVDNDGALGGSAAIQFGTEGKLTSLMPLVDASWQSILQQVRAYTEGTYSIAADNGDGAGNYDPTPPDWVLHTGGSDENTENGNINSGAIGSYIGTDTYVITAGIKTFYDFTGIGGADVLSSPPDAGGYVRVTYNYTPYVTDIGVTKDVDSNTHYYGDDFPFTITATNHGPDNATGVQIQDNLPAGLSLQSYTASVGSYSGGIWNIGNLNSGVTVTLTLNVRATGTGTMNNTASLYAVVQQDNNPANNSDSETVTVPSESDLSLTKTVSDPTPDVGDNITYTITLNNAGPNTATGVTVDDDLPAGLLYQTHSASIGTYNSGTGIWSIPSMPAGSRTLTITVQVTASGITTNHAQVTAAIQRDPDSTPNNYPGVSEDDDDDATITVPVTADLRLSKTATALSPPVVDLGENVRFDITLTNDGPDAAHNVTVEDILDSDFAFVSASPAGVYNSGTGIWTVGTLNSGASVTLQITATVNATGSIPNMAQVHHSDEHDPDSTPDNDTESEDDQQTVTVSVPRNVDLSLTKVLQSAPSPLRLGSNVTFRVTVTNSGPDNASGVHVRDLLPAGDFAFVSSSAPAAYNGTTGDWNIGNLNNGASVSLDITATVLKTTPVTNSAQVSACNDNDTDSTPDNWPGVSEDDNASVTVDADPAADLRLSKTAVPLSPPNVDLGENVRFDITLTNDGPDAAHNVTVEDILDSDFTFVSASPAGVYNSGTGIWTVGTLNSGASVALQITATANATGDIPNTAQVHHSDEYDPDSTPDNDTESEDDQQTVTVSVPRIVDLNLQKMAPIVPSPLRLGDNVTYTIYVTNLGPDNATGVHVRDLLPAGELAFVSSSAPAAYNSTTGDWNIGTLNANAMVTLDITATVLKTTPVTNSAQVSACNEHDIDSTPDNWPGANEDDNSSLTLYPDPAADLRLQKDVTPGTTYIGGSVVFTIALTNDGPDAAHNVTVEDVLPAGLNFVSASTLKGSYLNDIWTVGTMNNGETATLQITASTTQLGSITNTAQVHASDEYDPDSVPDNDQSAEDDQDDAAVTVSPVADLSLTKMVDHASVDLQDTVTYTITLNNGGPSNATGIQVSDILSPRLTYISHSGGTYSQGTGIWSVGSLSNGSSVQLLIRARVDSGGVTNNMAQVSVCNEYDPDSTPGNDDPSEDDQDDTDVAVSAGTIGDRVWNDANGDKLQNPGETGMTGITVNLIQNGAQIGSAQTDPSGYYLFENLRAGSYRVEVDENTVPFNFARTTDNMPYDVSLAAGEIHLDADFGYKAGQGSIGELVWHDSNANGIQDSGEQGLNNVTVILKNHRDEIIATMPTNESGWYRFYGLPPRTYKVEVDESTLPGGFELTTGITQFTVELGLDEKYSDANFGYRILNSSVGDYVWNDRDGAADQDPEEPGLSGILLRLKQNNTVIKTDTTDATGAYLFSGLAPGTYTVEVDETTVPDDFSRTTAAAAFTVTLNGLDAFLDADFGYRSVRGLIGDFVWLDEDSEGDQDASEPGIPDVTVRLLQKGMILETDTTDADGLYLFADILPGDYTVDVDESTLPYGYILTTDNEPDNVTLEPYEHHLISDFGYRASVGSIGDFVWHDENRDGVQDPGEQGIPNITVSLIRNGQVYKQDTTDTNGLYLFERVPIGTYQVDVHSTDPDMPVLYFSTTENEPLTVTIVEGQDYRDADFGYAALQSGLGVIGDYAWHDSNWDRNQDPDEEQLSRVFVTLYLNGQFVKTKETDQNGIYHFYNLIAGEYDVVVDVYGPRPATGTNGSGSGSVLKSGRPVSLQGLDDWTITTIDSFHVSLAEGQIYLQADFGFAFPREAMPGSIGDFVWHDADEDGEQDAGENGIPGITVKLIQNGGTIVTAMTDAQGLYLFEDVFPGEYAVRVDETTVPDEYKRSSATEMFEFFLPGASEMLDADFGYRKLKTWNDGRRYVMARYQPWFADAQNDSTLRHWDKNYRGGYSDRPVIGEYDTYEHESLWEYHILSAWGSGIDGFVVDWYGRDSFENAGLKGLLNKAAELNNIFEKDGFRFEIIVSYHETARNSLEQNLTYLADSILIHPAYWGNQRGLRRPVYFYDSGAGLLDPDEVKLQMTLLLPEDAFLLWNEFELDFFDPADVCYGWVNPLEKSWDPEGKVWGETYLYTSYQRVNSEQAEGKLLFALGTVWPGYDDRQWSAGTDRWIDRQDTLVYQLTWDMVHTYNRPLPMPWCLVETWNDWNQGTGIEPTDTYGYAFTAMTRRNAARFKGLALNETGLDETGMLALRHLYQARTLQEASLAKPGQEALLDLALSYIISGNYPAAMGAADQVAGIDPPELTAGAVSDTSAVLFWPEGSETAVYSLYMTSDSSLFGTWSSWPEPVYTGSSNEAVIGGLTPDTGYFFAISVSEQALGENAVSGWIVNPGTGNGIFALHTQAMTSVEAAGDNIPDHYTLSRNYPNPFNPRTTLAFGLPEAGHVLLQVFDMRGRLISTLINAEEQAGYHHVVWEGTDDSHAKVSSGTYIIKMTSGKQALSRKVMLLK
ncbi:DUF11 domain-containing protein [bacterium]|nr:DUF11 domain-containing protein [bacterium]